MPKSAAPLPPGPAGDFARYLRALLIEAGQPDYSQMRRATGYGRSALSAAFAGKKVPTWELAQRLVRFLGGNVSEARQRWATARKPPTEPVFTQELADGRVARRQVPTEQSDTSRPEPHDLLPAPRHLPDHPYPSDGSALTLAPLDAGVVVPRQLPAPPRSFTGRADELSALTAELDNAAGQDDTVVITAIGGAGGIGKTWLALHWAHQHLDHFPDGQLFVDLHGFAPTGKPMYPETAVRGFLDALGVDPPSIPMDLDAQVGLYRSLIAGRRMLIVLDNAATAEQVIPLLPGSPTCTVLITSRDRLPRLINRHGARSLPLDVLPEAEARDLLAARLGNPRVAAEPDAVNDLLARCGRHPLALSLIAGHAQTQPSVPLATLATELRDTATRLDILDEDEPEAGLRAALSWSYHALTEQQARVFGLLGIAPGSDIGLEAAASLNDLPAPQARAVLRALGRVSLVDEHTPGRYRMHDLVRLYAAEQADRDQPPEHREAALRRMIDFYTHTAYAGDRLLAPHRDRIELDKPAAGGHPHPLRDAAAAWAWFEAEHPCLLASQQLARDRGWHTPVWELAWALWTFQWRRGYLHDQLTAWQAGVAAADQLGDPATHARAHRRLGTACARVGRHAEALRHLQQALTLAEDAGDLPGQAHTHYALSLAWVQQGEDQRALDHATLALRLFQGLDDPVGEAQGLNAVGWYAARLGHYDQARPALQVALTLYRRDHDPVGEAHALGNLGYIAHHTGQQADALDYYQQSLALLRQSGDTYHEALALDWMGQAHTTIGHHDEARAAWTEALQLYRQQGRGNDAARVQQQLDDLDKRDGANSRE